MCVNIDYVAPRLNSLGHNADFQAVGNMLAAVYCYSFLVFASSMFMSESPCAQTTAVMNGTALINGTLTVTDFSVDVDYRGSLRAFGLSYVFLFASTYGLLAIMNRAQREMDPDKLNEHLKAVNGGVLFNEILLLLFLAMTPLYFGSHPGLNTAVVAVPLAFMFAVNCISFVLALKMFNLHSDFFFRSLRVEPDVKKPLLEPV